VILSLRSALLDRLGFRHGFSLRSGGVSEGPYASLNLGRQVGDRPEAVQENHARFAREVGYDPARLYEVSQVHGAAVRHVDAAADPAFSRALEGDALVSGAAGTAVGIRVADCVPILLAAPTHGAVAAVHAGWRGVVAGVVEAAVDALAAVASTPPETLVAAIFPSIGPEAFEVGDDVAAQIAAAVGEPEVVLTGYPKPHVDLARAVCAQLRRAGLVDACIDRVEGCTVADPARFFSFRRDAGATGRHLAAIVARC